MRNRNRKLGTIIVGLLLFPLLSGCQSSGSSFSYDLPPYPVIKPERPSLYEVDDSLQLPVPVIKNTILLQGYAKELEEYADGWERFYEELRSEMNENIQD